MKYFLFAVLAVCIYAAPAFSQCDSSKSSAQLNVNNINAKINNAGELWYGKNCYIAPKSGDVAALFGGGLWIGGFDNGGSLHLAAATMPLYGKDFSVGPINFNGSFDFDTVWVIYKSTIDSFNNGAFGGTIPNSIKYWPANGNPYLTNLPKQDLAPFVDVNNNGIYDPVNGDYPDIKGDEATWEIFNDGCAPHTLSGGLPLMIEVHLMAYAINDTGCLSNTTFYQYEIINDSNYTYDSTYIGIYANPDIGCLLDDFTGCIPGLNMGVGYNGEAVDGPCTPNYDSFPPILGVQMVNLPVNENGDTMHVSDFLYYDNDLFGPTGTPSKAIDYYHYMKAIWKDSTHVTYGGSGYGGTTNYNYMWPSDPTDTMKSAWSECSGHDIYGNRYFIMGFGPFTFKPHAIEKYTFDVLFDNDTLQIHYPCPSFASLINMANCVKEANVTGINQITANNAQLTFYPNPMGDAGTFSFKANTVKEIKLFNILGEQVRDYNNISGTLLQIEKTNLSEGIYIYTALLNNGLIENGKIIIQ